MASASSSRPRTRRRLAGASLTLLMALPATYPSRAAAATASRIEKLGEILDWEVRQGPPQALEAWLRDRDPTVKRRAALAAGRLPDPATVPALVDQLNDPVPEVRQMAAFALGRMGRAAGDLGTERLIAALRDSDSGVRARSAEALGRLGGARAGRALAEFVVAGIPRGAPVLTIRGDDPGSPQDPWLELRLGVLGLARLGDPKLAAGALLLSGQPRFDWWAATYAAARLRGPALRPVLVAAATASDPLSRALAAEGLGALADAGNLEPLSRLARDPEPSVATAALRALAATADDGARPAVERALRAKDPEVVWQALRALDSLPPAAELRERLAPFLGQREAWLRAAAFRALGRHAPDELAFLLSGLDEDPAWQVRSAIATALASVGDEVSLGILHRMLADKDARVLPAVLEGLWTVRGRDSAPTLLDHLDHPDPMVRAAAARGLQTLGADAYIEPLVAAYRRALTDLDGDARQVILEILGGSSLEPAREVLEQAAASDPDFTLRREAVALLVSRGIDARFVPDRDDRAPLDYREAMVPYDPRLGDPVFTPRAFLYTQKGRIEIRLNVIEAPLSCESFVRLAQRGFYDGLTFHRVVPGVRVEGGCPRGDGHGGPGYRLRSEPGLYPHGRGAVGLVGSTDDRGGSQFFIALAPQPQLDGDSTLLGWVVEGLELLDGIRPGDRIDRVEVWTGE
jgi:peptidyl-prolyl cis-trans isomerase B (cyclophilin B)